MTALEWRPDASRSSCSRWLSAWTPRRRPAPAPSLAGHRAVAGRPAATATRPVGAERNRQDSPWSDAASSRPPSARERRRDQRAGRGPGRRRRRPHRGRRRQGRGDGGPGRGPAGARRRPRRGRHHPGARPQAGRGRRRAGARRRPAQRRAGGRAAHRHRQGAGRRGRAPRGRGSTSGSGCTPRRPSGSPSGSGGSPPPSADLADREAALAEREAELAEAEEQRRRELERVAGLTADAARAELIEAIETQAKREAALLVRDIEADARNTAEQRARHIVVDAIQRVASEQTAESVVSVLHLPGDEMKGRIIGREGRNIRAFESVTGVNLIIDDTPEAVLLSCFDPVRREIGRLTLEKLVLDGRIHPHRIEEVYDAGPARGRAALPAGRRGRAGRGRHHRHPPGAGHPARPAALPHLVRAERAQAPGRDRAHRRDHGRRAAAGRADSSSGRAFLHDIGKALTHEVEGSHALIGADLARKYGESEDVVHAIEAHHNEVPPQTIEAVLTQAVRRLLRRPAGRAPGEPGGVRQAAGADRGDRRPASRAWRRSSPCRPAGRSG